MRRLIFLFMFGFVCFSPSNCFNEDENINNNIIIDAPFENFEKKFEPNWKDLDTRQLPKWYDDAKIGIFIHWGLYCVPGFRSEWFWAYWKGGDKNIVQFMNNTYPPGFTYQDFAPMFKAEFFNASEFADLFVNSGAKYVVLTSKHHEGFTLFPSKRSFGWNSVDTGPHLDLVGDLANAVRQKGLKFGVYHSLYEWYNPIYLEDKKANFTTRHYAGSKLWPDLKQLVNDYKPSVIWSDGDWEANDTYWKSTDLLAWLYNDSPVRDEVVVNDRWGIGTSCKHGDFYNCEDRYNPGKLQNHKWENALTLDLTSWGYRRNIALREVIPIERLLKEVISTVSCGGNALINIGPTKEGTIAPIFAERLLGLGNWLKINGEGIYKSSPWLSQNDTFNDNVWYTCKKQRYNYQKPTAKPTEVDIVTAIYAFFLKWPTNDEGMLVINDITKHLQKGNWQVVLLGNGEPLHWETTVTGKTKIYLPRRERVNSRHAWTLKFTPV
ncbi:hypothetical protein evm_000600 [Chilo suppressalis]|nr:hypothetical protein evm_000600 [Chilo suppressalis]